MLEIIRLGEVAWVDHRRGHRVGAAQTDLARAARIDQPGRERYTAAECMTSGLVGARAKRPWERRDMILDVGSWHVGTRLDERADRRQRQCERTAAGEQMLERPPREL